MVLPGRGSEHYDKSGVRKIIDGVDESIIATVENYTNSNPVAVTLKDTNGDYVSGGGGTQYQEGVTTDPATGTAMLGRNSDDSELKVLQLNASDILKIEIASDTVGIGGGTQYTDDTDTHISGTTKGTGMLAAATPTDGSVDANDLGIVAMSTDRRLHVDAQIVGSDADVPITLDGEVVTVAQATAANLNCTEASASAIKTAVEVMDDWDESDRCKVNIQAAALTSLGFLDKEWSQVEGNRTNSTTFTAIAAGGASTYTWIKSLFIVNNASEDLEIEIEENGGTVIIHKLRVPAYGGQINPTFPGKGFKQTNANVAVDIDVIDSSSTHDFTYVIHYTQET